jgi:HAE1 family hydrophobic/amphiphilic exporter-1
MVFLVLAGVGAAALRTLPIDMFPSAERPLIVVSTSYSGAGPAEVEREVTDVLEKALAGVGGLEQITSTSSEGSSRLILNFNLDADLERAADDIRDILAAVKGRLPDDAGDPRMQRFDPSSWPIMNIALVGNFSAEELRRTALDYVQADLEQVAGVGQAEVRGGRDLMVKIEVDRTVMESYGFTLTDIARAVDAQNADASGGSIPQGERRYLVKTVGSFASVDEVGETIVGYAKSSAGTRLSAVGSRPVRLAELASVRLAPADETQIVLINGVPGVYISVQKESGTNSVKVADAVRERLDLVRANLPRGMDLRVIEDTTISIKASLDQVIDSLVVGGLLTLAVLFFFLRNVRAAFAIALSIPISLLATILAMSVGGLSLNTISLSGLILGIGMIVDSSIVILENIHRRRAAGLGAEDAAIVGAAEMIDPIMGSALTTVCVFAPVLFFRKGLGDFSFMIGDIAFTVIFAILASLAVAILLVPVLASTFLPLRAEGDRFKKLRFLKPVDAFFERLFTALENAYAAALRLVLAHRLLTVVVVVSLLGASLSYAPRIPFIFSPPSAEDSVSISLQLREGTVLESTRTAALTVADAIAAGTPDLTDLLVNIGGGATSSHQAQITARLPPAGSPDRVSTTDAVAAAARSAAAGIPGLRLTVRGNRGRGLAGANPIEIVVRSRDYDAAQSVARSIASLIREEFPQIVEPQVNVPNSLSELSVVVDRKRAADLGVTASAAAAELKAVTAGAGAGVYRERGTEYDIQVALRPGDRSSLPDLERTYVKSSGGERIPVASFAALVRSESPVSIVREKGRRAVRVTASMAPGEEAAKIEPLLVSAVREKVELPDGVTVEYAGELAAINKTGSQLTLVLAVAIALVFAVMASQFESFIAPFIIFLAIPTMVIGVVAIYAVLGQPFSMFSLLGLIMLAGIVVNNGIVLVDYTNLLRVRGMPLSEAIVEAGRHRLRPILITTITTICGMVPLAFFPGEGARITQPVGITIVGGLASSVLMTLFFVPTLYSLIAARSRIRREDPESALGTAD